MIGTRVTFVTRYMTAVTLSQLAKLLTLEVMTAVVEDLVPRLEHATVEQHVRQGELLIVISDPQSS